MILINLTAEEQKNLLSNKNDSDNFIDKDDSDEKNRLDIIKMLKKEVFDEKSTTKQVSDLRRIIIKFTDKFTK